MDLGLGDKVVVITGASKGIGLAMAEAFAGEGARVVAGSRTKGEALRELSRGYPVVPVEVDLGVPEGPGELVGRAVEEFGGVDVLVNNMGAIAPRGGFLSVGDEDWRWATEMNLMTAVRATRAALPVMLGRGGGARQRLQRACPPARAADGRLLGGQSRIALWLGAEALTAEFAGETLARYEVTYSANVGRLREAKTPRLYTTRYHYPAQPRLFGLAEFLGEAGWLKAVRLRGYAPRGSQKHPALQQALFAYAEAL